MCDDEQSKILEFKRQFILQNIADVKREWYRHDDYREKLRFWFLTVWFGTVAIFLKDQNIKEIFFLLPIIETAIFFGLEVFFYKQSSFRIKRISVMEHWIMSASPKQIIELDGPLAKIAPWDNTQDLAPKAKALLNPNVSLLYWVFIALSIILFYFKYDGAI